VKCAEEISGKIKARAETAPKNKQFGSTCTANGCVSINNTKCNETAALVPVLKTTVVLQYATDEARLNFVNWYFMEYKMKKQTTSSFCYVFISLNV